MRENHGSHPFAGLSLIIQFAIFVAFPLGIGLTMMLFALDRWDEREIGVSEAARMECLDRAVACQDIGFPFPTDQFFKLQDTRYGYSSVKDFDGWMADFSGNEASRPIFQIFTQKNEYYSSPNNSLREFFRDVLDAVFLNGPEFEARARVLDPTIARKLGAGCSLAVLQRKNGEYQRVDFNGKPAILLLEFHPKGLAMILLLPAVSREQLRVISERWSQTSQWSTTIGKAVPQLDIWNPPQGFDASEFRLAWKMSEKTGTQQIEKNGRVWCFFLDRWGKLTCLLFPVSNSAGGGGLRGLAIGATFLAAIWGWLLVSKWGTGTKQMFVPISFQLRVFFLYVTLLPLLSSVLLGWFILQDQEDRLQQTAFTNCIRRLNVLEGSYAGEFQEFLARGKNIRNWVVSPPEKNVRSVQTWFNKLHARHFFEFIHVLDQDGKAIFTNLDETKKSLIRTYQILNHVAIREFMPNRLPSGAGSKISALDLLAEECITSEEFGWARLALNPGYAHPLVMGRSPVDFYWDVYPERASGPTTIMLSLDRHWLVTRFLEKSMGFESEKIRLYGMNMFLNEFLQPQPKLDAPQLREFISVCEKAGKMQQRRLELKSGPAWAVAMTESLSGRFGIVAILEARESLALLDAWRWGLGFAVLGALFVAAIAGQLLAGLFLIPIHDLAGGIEGVAQRRRDIRIPVRRPDEFGRLAEAFNRMISGLHELEFAKIVQTDLLPESMPKISGYSIAAYTQTATKLGGDYYDVVPLDDESFLLLVGDVTGHGAPAALAMAMAKAGVAFQLQTGRISTQDLLEALNHVFFTELKPMHRFMTMLVVLFETRKNYLTLRNAGQNFPIIIPKGSQGKMLEIPGFPLGIRKKCNFEGTALPMNPGDVFVMYTDGLPEAPIQGDLMVGQERLSEIFTLCSRKSTDADEILTEILSAFDRIRKPGPYPDDVTLIVLRRD